MVAITLSGGKRLERYLQRLSANVSGSTRVDIGFMSGATYQNGTPVPLVAALNEFGVPARGQPPRPFFRRMIAKHKGEWGGQLGAYLEANDFKAAIALNKMGGLIGGELAESISELVSPPLAPYTIQKKGFDKPLIETAHMFQSITHEVSDESA